MHGLLDTPANGLGRATPLWGQGGGSAARTTAKGLAHLLVRRVTPNLLADVFVQLLREGFHEPVRQRLANQGVQRISRDKRLDQTMKV